VFGKGSVVPTASEERALYLHALCGELARSVEAIDGVVEARVHLAPAPPDPLRSDPPPPARASVLVKILPGARARIEPQEAGIRALVAGAVAGLDPATVAVVVSEAGTAATAPPRERRPRRALWSLAAVAAALAVAVPGLLVTGRLDVLRRRRAP
jgi:type III secretion protein J